MARPPCCLTADTPSARHGLAFDPFTFCSAARERQARAPCSCLGGDRITSDCRPSASTTARSIVLRAPDVAGPVVSAGAARIRAVPDADGSLCHSVSSLHEVLTSIRNSSTRSRSGGTAIGMTWIAKMSSGTVPPRRAVGGRGWSRRSTRTSTCSRSAPSGSRSRAPGGPAGAWTEPAVVHRVTSSRRWIAIPSENLPSLDRRHPGTGRGQKLRSTSVRGWPHS